MSEKEIPVHKDRLDRVINVGDCVCYVDGNHMEFGKITKLNPKMVRVIEVPTGKYGPRYNNKYPDDVVVVDGPEVSMFLLKISA